jgi:hypothetical protein
MIRLTARLAGELCRNLAPRRRGRNWMHCGIDLGSVTNTLARNGLDGVSKGHEELLASLKRQRSRRGPALP